MTKDKPKSKADKTLPEYLKQDEISFLTIILILVRHVKLIIILPATFSFLAIIYVLFFTKPYYTSTSKLMTSSSSVGGLSQAAGLAEQFGLVIPASQSTPNWGAADIIKSRTLARALLKRKFDTKEFGLGKSFFQILTYGNNEPKFNNDTLEFKAVDKVVKMINLSEDRRSGHYTITLSASEPQLAADIITVLIEELDKHQKEYNKALKSKARQFIEGRINAVAKELVQAEETLKDFTASNRRIENSPLLLLEQQRLGREVSVLTNVYTMLKQQLETTKIEEVKESEYVIVLDPPEAPIEKSGPKRKKIVLMAGLLGIGLSVFISLLVEFIQSNKKWIDQLKNIFIKNLFS